MNDLPSRLAAALLALGLLLLGYMVAVEGEPGAVPLLLVIAGGAGLAFARGRQRRRAG